jgi:hypothetical protein
MPPGHRLLKGSHTMFLLLNEGRVLYYLLLIIFGIAFLTSLISFVLDYPIQLKVFSLLIGLTLVDEGLSFYLVKFMHTSNLVLYNIFMGLETLGYAFYFRMILNSPRLKKGITGFMVIFPIFWAIVVFWIFGIHRWNSYLAIVDSLLIVCLSVAYYHQLFTSAELLKLSNHAEFWIATGLILCYACVLPYTGMLNFLNRNFPVLSHELLSLLQLLNIIMYILFICAFVCRIHIRKLS